MTREEQIVQRVKDSLVEEGYAEKTVLPKESGYGDAKTFFDFLVDLKLEGKPVPSQENIWNDMKAQILHLQMSLFLAS